MFFYSLSKCRSIPRLGFRCYQKAAVSAQRAPSGLRYIPEFISSKEHDELTIESLKMLQQIHQYRETSDVEEVKARTSLSKQHNLTTDEYYEKIEIVDHNKRRRAQYFDKYGESGHELTYFMNNSNIPSFVMNDLVSKLVDIQEVKALSGDTPHLNWMFTFNAYSPSPAEDKNGRLAGFPYHVDSDFNGDVTVILTLMAPADMELRPVDIGSDSGCLSRIGLTPGSLLLLSGEARWKWQHRVIPKRTQSPSVKTSSFNDGVQRMSLVLGCRQLK